ncbi:hypothetical protein PVAP13_8KG149303 [Panicum virgatum]|uniref:Uncharacterized protein n=1 Tax=Panicum virgatum TaxID=38727 RepID=A0A8T0PT37_PANVG|nr:hypothetical protein PVAP13_8KG149303 [Panicum virgatum]
MCAGTKDAWREAESPARDTGAEEATRGQLDEAPKSTERPTSPDIEDVQPPKLMGEPEAPEPTTGALLEGQSLGAPSQPLSSKRLRPSGDAPEVIKEIPHRVPQIEDVPH